MVYSAPCFPVLHHLLELVQTHTHLVSDTTQPSHPLLFPSPPAFNLSQHQVFSNESALHSGGQSTGVSASAPVLSMNIQGWFPLGLTGLISAVQGTVKSLPQHHSSEHQTFGAQPSLWSNSHIGTWLLEKSQLWLYGPLLAKWYLCFLICCLGLSKLVFQGASVF